MTYDLSFITGRQEASAAEGRPNSHQLRITAARCFRLAQGPASRRLADELEAIGRAFEQEAQTIECCALSGQG
jgi:hypothetical protein